MCLLFEWAIDGVTVVLMLIMSICSCVSWRPTSVCVCLEILAQQPGANLGPRVSRPCWLLKATVRTSSPSAQVLLSDIAAFSCLECWYCQQSAPADVWQRPLPAAAGVVGTTFE